MAENRQEVVKHLELIQNVINRMGSDAFRAKEWSVVLVTGILALGVKDGN